MTTFNSSGDTGNNQGEGNPQGASFQQQKDNGGQPSTSAGESGDTSGNIDVSKLAKRLDDSQSFIETLKSERQSDQQRIQELEAKLQSTPTVDQIMEQLNQRQGTSNDNLDTEDLVNKAAAAVQANLTRKEQEKLAEDNFRKVQQTLAEKLGAEGIDTKVKQLAEQNDLTFEQVLEMAKKSPKATLRLLGISEEASSSGGKPPVGSVNTTAYQGNQGDAPKPRSIVKAITDKDRIDVTKEYFKKHGLQF